MDVIPGAHLLGRYTTVERLGTGGMAEVWRATDDVLGTDVAIKFLARHLVADTAAREQFRREAQLAGTLSHPHVVAVHDAGTEGDAMLLVMEIVEGGTLEARMAESRHDTREALLITGGILAGLASAHAAGLVHGDIKPGNVMFTADGRVKVADFGLARLATGQDARSGAYGSMPYVAPEHFEGLATGPAADVYAVGCVLYQLLTGISPFVGDTPSVTMARHLSYQPPPPSALVAGVAPGLDAVVGRALAKDPADRYPDASAMLADVERIASADTVEGLAAGTVALVRRLTRSERRAAAADAEQVLAVAPPRRRIPRPR